MKPMFGTVPEQYPKFDWELVNANNFPACQTQLVEKTADNEVLEVKLTMEDGTVKKALVSGEITSISGPEIYSLLGAVYEKVKDDKSPVEMFQELLRH